MLNVKFNLINGTKPFMLGMPYISFKTIVLQADSVVSRCCNHKCVIEKCCNCVFDCMVHGIGTSGTITDVGFKKKDV